MSPTININVIWTAVDLLVCISIHDIQEVRAGDTHLQELQAYIIKGWPQKRKLWQKTYKVLAIQT